MQQLTHSPAPATAAPDTSDVTTHLVRQPLDHFDGSERRTWTQRVHVRATFFERDRPGPVFLCVGGEGPPLGPEALVASVHCNDAVELAPVVGALLVAAEHRFYGPDAAVRPLPSFDTPSLRYLSSSQAVTDLANVHAFVSANHSLDARRHRWVSFGGSYPGLVAGYARLKMPHLFHAAVSSSSPWRSVVDMPQYNDVVASALANPLVGGSAACAEAVRAGHEALGHALKRPASRRELAGMFRWCNASSLERASTARAWAGAGAIAVPAQSNDPACSAPCCDIRAVCAEIGRPADGQAALRALARVSRAQRGSGGGAEACIADDEFDPEAAMRELERPASAARAWPYQTCAEYGFFQTCEWGSRCPFVRGALPLADSFAMCERAFGIPPEQVRRHVAATNRRYGGASPRATRVLFLNGDVDPWSALGVLASPDGNRSEVTMVVRGASHHAWTHPADTVVQPAVRDAKRAVWRQVQAWLHEPDSDAAEPIET